MNKIMDKLCKCKPCAILFLMTMLLIFVSSCGREEKKTEQVKTESNKEYQEMQLDLPESAEEITSLVIQDNGKIRVGGSEKSVGFVWEKGNDERKWKKVISTADIPEMSALSPANIEVSLSSQSEAVVSLSIPGEREEEFVAKEYLIRADNSIQKLNTEEFVWCQYRFSPDGELFFIDESNQVHLIDKTTGDVSQTYKRKSNQQEHITILPIDEQLLVITNEQVEVYDIKNGNKEKEEKTFQKLLVELKGKEITVASRAIENQILIQAGTEIFCYDIKKDTIETLLDMKNLALEEGLLYKIIPENLNKFYVVQQFPKQPTKIYQYTTGTEARTYEDTLRIYTLEENKEMLRMLGRYRTMNPNVNVILEVGMADGNVTKDDAIKQLNTRILGGEGPDILVLDSLNIEKYIEEELLTDLNDAVYTQENSSHLFDNIVSAYKTDKGLYAVPTRFSVPIITGKEELLNSISSVTELSSEIKKISKAATIIGPKAYPEDMMKICYYADAGNWISADKKINKEKVEGYFDSILSIYKKGGYIKKEYENQKKREINPFNNNLRGIYENDTQLTFAEVNGWTDIEIIYHMKNEKNMSYQTFGNEAEKSFIPKQIVGVLNGSTHQDRAKQFVAALVSDEVQNTFDAPFEGEGLPINIESMDYWLSRHHVYVEKGGLAVAGKRRTIEIAKMTEEERNEWIDFVKRLNVPASSDSKLDQIVFTSGQDCIDGKISAKDAASKVVQYYELAESERE